MAQDRGKPAKPPAGLKSRKLPLRELAPATWWRIHRAALAPCFYSEDPGSRFSSTGLGVLYLADAPDTSLWEIHWDDLGPLPPEERRIAETQLRQRVVRKARVRRALNVFDATNRRSLRAVSATAGTFTSTYAVCQAWAIALARHPTQPDGILYPSARNAGASCLALFAGRTSCDDIKFQAETPLSDSPEIVRALLDEGVAVLGD